MLGKLLKYELKSYIRVFIPIYIAIIAMSFLNGIFGNSELFKVQSIMTMVLVGLFVALLVLSIVITIQRFRKNLLEDEGYLMFTLPVSTSNIIISKYLASLIFTILSGLVAALSFLIIMATLTKTNPIEIISHYNMFFKELLVESDFRNVVIISSVAIFLTYSIFILEIYLSLSMGQLPKFNKHRNLVGLVTFFIVNTAIGYIVTFIMMYLPVNFNYEEHISEIITLSTSGSNYIFIVNFIIIGLLFASIVYILNKKLNLE